MASLEVDFVIRIDLNRVKKLDWGILSTNCALSIVVAWTENNNG